MQQNEIVSINCQITPHKNDKPIDVMKTKTYLLGKPYKFTFNQFQFNTSQIYPNVQLPP